MQTKRLESKLYCLTGLIEKQILYHICRSNASSSNYQHIKLYDENNKKLSTFLIAQQLLNINLLIIFTN